MSSSFPDALTFLESVAGYNQQIAKASLGSAVRPIRLAVIDPAYVASTYPGILPRVTFEGEDTLSDKRYPVLGNYRPQPSDRVVLFPVGHTYVIAGVLNTPTAPVFDTQSASGAVTTTTLAPSWVSLTGGPSATINLRAGQYARVIMSCEMYISVTGTNGSVMSFRSTGASGTVEATQADGMETGVVDEWVPAERTTIWGPASAGGSHTFEARYQVINAGTANFKQRRVIAEAL